VVDQMTMEATVAAEEMLSQFKPKPGSSSTLSAPAPMSSKSPHPNKRRRRAQHLIDRHDTCQLACLILTPQWLRRKHAQIEPT